MITVILSATLRAYVPAYDPEQGVHYPPKGGETAGDIAKRLRIPHEEIMVIFLNGRHAKLDTAIQDGDRLAFFPPVGGG